MKAKIMLSILLPLSFFYMRAQKCEVLTAPEMPLVFESVSFSAEQGSVTIKCIAPANLSQFEFIAEDTHYAFEWDAFTQARCFPMKLNFKPGKVIIKYKMKGEKEKTLELNIEANEALKLSI
ncbi:MAG: hypothetical protein H6576_13305 [Lewinellaceae bacterium]|nr:hypothetical protein [Saprospiraceae bacterium]MCB9344674.1 hypothetical protein [Lewinellaceae bacterium]